MFDGHLCPMYRDLEFLIFSWVSFGGGVLHFLLLHQAFQTLCDVQSYHPWISHDRRYTTEVKCCTSNYNVPREDNCRAKCRLPAQRSESSNHNKDCLYSISRMFEFFNSSQDVFVVADDSLTVELLPFMFFVECNCFGGSNRVANIYTVLMKACPTVQIGCV